MHAARLALLLATVGLSAGPLCAPAGAAPFFFSTGAVDGLMALSSRPPGPDFEVDAADDFVLTTSTRIGGAVFTGLIPASAPLSSIAQVRVKIDRVFPADSDLTRTSGPAVFSTTLVPTRVNSPSDVAFAQRDSATAGLSFTAGVIASSFSVINSVQSGGIHPIPGQFTAGTGQATGEAVTFNVTFTPALNLAADHYFFVPQVRLSSGDFLWLSAPKPIAPPGTTFPAGSTDLQSFTRDANLAPDWLRVTTDIVHGATTFNGAFSLSGSTCTAISVAPATIGAASAGAPYSATFSAIGGVAPHTFTETGPLPTGVGLTPAGALTGTPTQSGSFPIVVTATDATGCVGTGSVTLTVAAAATQPTTPSSPPGQSPSPAAGPPAISGARLSPTTFRAAGHGATLARKRRTPIGTTVSYRESAAATTTFTVLRPVTGHRRGSRCVAGRPHRHQKRCTRYATLGSSPHVEGAGSVKVHFSGRRRGHKLAPDRYRLTLTPKAGGRAGRTVMLAFRIVR